MSSRSIQLYRYTYVQLSTRTRKTNLSNQPLLVQAKLERRQRSLWRGYWKRELPFQLRSWIGGIGVLVSHFSLPSIRNAAKGCLVLAACARREQQGKDVFYIMSTFTYWNWIWNYLHVQRTHAHFTIQCTLFSKAGTVWDVSLGSACLLVKIPRLVRNPTFARRSRRKKSSSRWPASSRSILPHGRKRKARKGWNWLSRKLVIVLQILKNSRGPTIWISKVPWT